LYYIKNKKILLLLTLLILVFILVGSVFLIDNALNGSTSTVGGNLKGYAQLKQKFDALAATNQNAYRTAMEQFNVLEDKKASAKTQYTALAKTAFYLSDDYAKLFNPKIYSLVNKDFAAFAKNNFGSYFKQNDFSIPCQDPTCAESPQPKDIINIINEIKAEPNIPDGDKNAMIGNLTNAGFITGSDYNKAWNYFMAGQIIRSEDMFTKAGVNDKYANEVQDYIKNKFPDAYKKL
jgi:hypothetical protein